jgi:hypothetical protein
LRRTSSCLKRSHASTPIWHVVRRWDMTDRYNRRRKHALDMFAFHATSEVSNVMLQLAFAGDDAQSRRINGNARMKGRTLTVERDRMPDRDISQVTFGQEHVRRRRGRSRRGGSAYKSTRLTAALGASPADATLRPQPAGGRGGGGPSHRGFQGVAPLDRHSGPQRNRPKVGEQGWAPRLPRLDSNQ